MALDATIGGASADSYISVDDADTYFGAHVTTAVWDAATVASKEKGLKMATRLLDQRYDWAGEKVSDSQSLRWPRSNAFDKDGDAFETNELPLELTQATAEFAQYLLTSDTTKETDGRGLTSTTVDTISVVFDKADKPDVLPDIVVEMLRGLGVVHRRGGVGSASVVRV